MPSDRKTTLIIGSDGFLGKNFARYFAERGWETHKISRADGDLSDFATTEALFRARPKVDRILHAVTRQRTGAIQYGLQGELLATNARIHLNVLEAWRLHQPQAKLISTGSSCTFPELARSIVEGDFQAGPMHDSVRGYGLAKQVLAVGSEVYASQYGLKYLHLFLATLYGPQDHREPNRAHFMGGMIDRAVREFRGDATEFTVWGVPDTVRDLLYVDDQVEAILAADAIFENCRLNCVSNQPVTIDTCAQAILTALGWSAQITYVPGTFTGTAYKTLDASKFLRESGWRPKVDLLEGIGNILDREYASSLSGR